jgi:hypothetical protein
VNDAVLVGRHLYIFRIVDLFDNFQTGYIKFKVVETQFVCQVRLLQRKERVEQGLSSILETSERRNIGVLQREAVIKRRLRSR